MSSANARDHFIFLSVSLESLETIVCSLKNSSPRQTIFPVSILKELFRLLSSVLLKICNKSLEQRTFRSSLKKKTKVIRIPVLLRNGLSFGKNTVVKTRTTPHYFSQLMSYLFKRIRNVFSMYFCFTYQISSTIDVWHICKSSYDDTTKKLPVSSYELVNICQASVIDFTLKCKKHKSNVLMF